MLRGILIYSFGSILQKSAAFLLIPIYTHYISTDQYGVYGVLQSINQAVIVILAFGINSSVSRIYYEYFDDRSKLKEYVSSNLVFLLTVSAVLALIFFYVGEKFWGFLFQQIPFSPYVKLMLWTAWSTVLTQFALGILRARKDPVRYIFLQAIRFLVQTGFIVLFVVYMRLEAAGQLMGLMAGSIAAAVLSVAIILKDYFTLKVRWRYVSEGLRYGIPLIPHLLGQWVRTSFDRAILERFSTLNDVGIYSLGANLGIAMRVLVSSTNMAYVPFFFEMMKGGESRESKEVQFKVISSLYVFIFGTICLIGILFSRDVVFLLAPSSYHEAAEILPIILLGYLFQGYYFLAVNIILFHMRSIWMTLITGVTAVSSILINYLLIPRFGFLGAAWTFLLASLISFLFTSFAARKLWPVNLPIAKFVIINSMIMIGVLWSTVFGMQVSALSILCRLITLLLFSVVSYRMLVGENVHWLRERFQEVMLIDER